MTQSHTDSIILLPYETLFNIGGLLGVVMMVLAYFLISAEKLSSKSLHYHVLNLVGATLVLLSLLINWNLPAFAIEVTWIAISLYGIFRAIRNKT